MKEKSKKGKSSPSSTRYSRTTHQIKKRIVQVKKRIFSSHLRSILEDNLNIHSNSYTNNQSAYLIVLYFTKYFNGLAETQDSHAFLCALTIINDLKCVYTDVECHLLGCTVFAIISKIFFSQRFKAFSALIATSPFTYSHLEATEAQILDFLNFNLPKICIQQPDQVEILLMKEEEKILKGVSKKLQNNSASDSD